MLTRLLSTKGQVVADCATKIEAARHLIWHAASLRDTDRPCLKEVAMAKLFASEMAEEVCSAAIQTLGGYGYVSDFPSNASTATCGSARSLRAHRAEDHYSAGSGLRHL